MRLIRKSEKKVVALLLILALVVSIVACNFVVSAKENPQSAKVAAGNYYLWGLNTNDPDFGAMTAPTGSFSYDGTKGYYYYDLTGTSGDYCFVVSAVNNSGSTAVKSPAVGGVQNAGNYYLSQGNYHGYACMHIWNPAGQDVRIYFTSETAGLNAIPLSQAGDTPTTAPTSSSTQSPTPTSAPPVSGGYVYCEDAAGWGTVFAYMWNSDDDKNATWPGERMQKISDNVWRYQVTGSYANIIFNIGSEMVQTGDMVYPGAGMIYNNKTYQWSVYGGSSNPTVGPTSSPTSIAPTSQQPTTPSGAKVVYCENEAGWSVVSVYMWNGSGGVNNGVFPGQNATNIGGNIWRYTLPRDYENIIFSENKNSQTPDMKFPGSGYMYNNKTQEWSIYDTSPLQVQTFTTDLSAPQFAGTGIVLTANAVGEGTVKYKFSVTSSSSTKVIADYSTKNSALWTPTASGSYTIVYEFKDTKGNTNKRTLAYTIDDGSASSNPFIKQVTPISGEQILKSSSCSITVSAGGGKTGTNLLFYKYTVTDASGKTVNVPYYTRNTSFSFTPTALGKYTVTVSVQASDNSTVERDYVYDSVGSIVTPTEPDEPDPTTPSVGPGGATCLGDADMDGNVTILDATRIQRWLASLITDADIHMANADADKDNSVTILDATRIQRFLANLISEL